MDMPGQTIFNGPVNIPPGLSCEFSVRMALSCRCSKYKYVSSLVREATCHGAFIGAHIMRVSMLLAHSESL